MAKRPLSEDILNLVTEVYASIVVPERFIDVLELWDKNISAENSTNFEALDIIDGQLSHAVPLLEVSLREVVNKDELVSRISEYDRPSLLVASNNFVIGSNASGRIMFNLGDGDRLDVTLLSKDNALKFRRMISKVEADTDDGTFQVMQLTTRAIDGGFDDHLVAVRRANVSNASHGYLLISHMDLVLPRQSIKAFQAAFDLTDAEMKIMVFLVAGHRQIDIAANLEVREDTVKKHIRQIRDKTNTPNTTALVCLAASFAQISAEQKRDHQSAHGDAVIVTNKSNQTYVMPTQHKLVKVNGVRVEYVEFGAKNGKPLIFMHSSMVGFILPPEFVNELVLAGYRLITPFRPSIGVSDPLKKCFSLGSIAEHILVFADALKLENFALLAGTIGFPYALKMATLAPERVTGIVGIAGYLPVDPEAIRSKMARYQRGILFTLQHNRNLAKFLMLNGYKMFLQLGAHKFMSQLMRDSKADVRVINDANILGIISVGLRIAGSQGVDALLNDSFLILSDWSDVLEKLDRPVYLLHGSDDSVFPIEIVEEICERYSNLNLTKLENMGQLMIYDSPRKFASLVLEKFSETHT